MQCVRRCMSIPHYTVVIAKVFHTLHLIFHVKDQHVLGVSLLHLPVA